MFRKFIVKAKSIVTAGLLAAGAVIGVSSVMSTPAHAQIDLSTFTDSLAEVGTAVNAALGDTVSAGLAIAGVIMGGLLLWRLFKRIAKA